MASTDKDTIYIDIDDEITAIIDKLRASEGKVVALVLPKRASVFQSIVNMKLLKRAADQSKKHLVLITNEAGLLPLAGAAGVHVAKTLTSKPEIPVGPEQASEVDDLLEDEEAPAAVTAEQDGDTPVGELAGLPAAATAADNVETVELPDEEAEPARETKAATPASKPKKDKKLAVPDFNRFRKWLVLGGIVLVALIVFLILAFTVLPNATISISTDAVAVNSNLDLKLSTTAQQLDPTDNTIPAKVSQQQKTYTQQVTATGQKNNGDKAKGTVTISGGSCSGTVPSDFSAGSPLVANGLTYITGATVSFVPTVSHGKCTFQGVDSNGNNSIPISAQNGGSNYNTGSGTSFSYSQRPEISASGSASGGTDNIVKVVSQSDIDNAKGKISTDDNSVKSKLQDDLKSDSYFPIVATFTGASPTVTTSANVGDTASSVTVTETVNYTMFGVRQDDLKTLVDADIKNQIDTSKQGILSEGLDTATFNVSNQNDKSAEVTMTTTGAVGPDINTGDIARDAAGKKPGDIKADIQANPDVTAVNVKLSPFWVSSAPKKVSKIKVTIEKPQAKAGSDH